MPCEVGPALPDYFIYWRVQAAEADAAERTAQQFQRRLRQAFPRLQVALYRRAGEPGPDVTLMEVYACEALGLPAAEAEELHRRIVAEGDAELARWLRGPRKVEAFVKRAPPVHCGDDGG
jgi:hypothetical protein